MSDSTLNARMKNLLLLIPNLVMLCGKLMVDPRVPTKERMLVAGAILYAVLPLDFIPDMIPFVGQIDDAYLIALSLLRLTTVANPNVVREHWRGGGDVVELIGATATIAAKFFLHEQVSSTRWTGVLFMMIGATLITYSEKVKERKTIVPPASAAEIDR